MLDDFSFEVFQILPDTKPHSQLSIFYQKRKNIFRPQKLQLFIGALFKITPPNYQ